VARYWTQGKAIERKAWLHTESGEVRSMVLEHGAIM